MRRAVHVPGRVCDNPVAVYSGSTQGLDPTEEGPRGCFVVELDEAGVREEFVETASIRWKNAAVDSAGLADLDALRAAVSEICQTARAESGGRPAVLRIDLGGRSELHSDLARPGVAADLLNDLREEQLAAEPWVWIDRLRDRTRPYVDLDAVAAEEGLRGDLVRLAARLSDDEETAAAALDDLLSPVLGQLPGRRAHGLSPREIIQRANDLCIDRLSGND